MTEGEVLERAYRNTARQEFSLISMEDIMREMFSAMASAPEDVEALERMIKKILPRCISLRTRNG